MAELDMDFAQSKRKQMQMMRDQGYKHREIAEKFGVSRQYVAQVCGVCDPAYYVPVDERCIYPNLRIWMNENKVSRKKLLLRMGLTESPKNYDRLTSYLRGDAHPRKQYIDRMLAATGMTYEKLFYTGINDDRRAEDG